MKSILRIGGLGILLFVLLAGGASIYERVGAAGTGAVTGFAWSATAGWISFSCSDTSTCGTSNYGVSVNPSSGLMTGYAWSSNVGWIRFDPANTNCPEPGNCEPAINLTTGAVTGFARACGGTVLADCVDQTDYENWDGWIRLSGSRHLSPVINGSKGVTYISANNKLVGYAWGGSSVMGWVKFNPGKGGGVTVDLDRTCVLLGTSYPTGAGVHYCARAQADTLSECGCIDATCQSDGTWTDSAVNQITEDWNLSCVITIPPENDCVNFSNTPCSMPNGQGIMACGESRKFYKNRDALQNASSTATCDDNYNSLIRTCVNSTSTIGLTGDPAYQYTTCRVIPNVFER